MNVPEEIKKKKKDKTETRLQVLFFILILVIVISIIVTIVLWFRHRRRNFGIASSWEDAGLAYPVKGYGANVFANKRKYAVNPAVMQASSEFYS